MSGAQLTEEELGILAEYHTLCHAMQTGVAFEQSHGGHDGTPKHLRVGVNTCKCDHAALVCLLVDKGIINRKEYFTAMREMMRREVETYRQRIKESTGTDITLA